MIQATTVKNLDPKALKSAAGKNASAEGAQDLMGSLEAQLFANELEASMETGIEAKPVKLNAEQALELPSTLVNPEAVNTGVVETTSPKVFDPALTKGVEKLIAPETTASQQNIPELTNEQVLKLADGQVSEVKGEITQAILKTPQVNQLNGRAPAIEMTQTEVDPQLLNMDDFVAQKNLMMKKPLNNAYGMQKPQLQQEALENGLKETQIVGEAASTESANGSVNSQQFILGMMSEQGSVSDAGDVKVAAPKTFDMSHVKSSDSNQIMNQVTDYIVQAKAAKEPTVNMRVKHDDLGVIDITVSKSGPNHEAVAINIGTHSTDGKNFFQQNSKDLFSHLANAGINVSDLKVETPTQLAKNDFDFGSQAGRGQQQGSEKQFGSEQNQRRHEQERRQDLWKLLNGEAA